MVARIGGSTGDWGGGAHETAAIPTTNQTLTTRFTTNTAHPLAATVIPL